jgi:c(7)-type cytochrome triheme protein
MAEMPCKQCHLKEQRREPLAKCTTCHGDLGGLHTASTHSGAGCTACHAPHAWSPEARKACLACHADKADHNPGPACAECHEFRAAAGAKASTKAGPPPITFPADPGSPGPVTFEHAKHIAQGARCPDCHPKLFKTQKGSTKFSMDAMADGKACGACHNGQKAFAAMDGDRCLTCHKGS